MVMWRSITGPAALNCAAANATRSVYGGITRREDLIDMRDSLPNCWRCAIREAKRAGA